jgi:hypothetical protein
MDFDRIEGQHKLRIVDYFCKTGRIGAMKKEIKKCEIVCANCYHARTHSRLQKAKKIIE